VAIVKSVATPSLIGRRRAGGVGAVTATRGVAGTHGDRLAWAPLALLLVSGLAGFLKPALLAERTLYLPSGRGGARRRRVDRLDAEVAPARSARPSSCARRGRGLRATSFVRAGLWRDDVTLMSRMVCDAPDEPSGHANLGPRSSAAAGCRKPCASTATRFALAGRSSGAFELPHRARKLGATPRPTRVPRGAGDQARHPRPTPVSAGWPRGRTAGGGRARVPRPVALDPAMRYAPQPGVLDRQAGGSTTRTGAARSGRPRPASPESALELGVTLGENGDLAGAATELRAALALRPRWVEAQFDLGVVLARQGLAARRAAPSRGARSVRAGKRDARRIDARSQPAGAPLTHGARQGVANPLTSDPMNAAARARAATPPARFAGTPAPAAEPHD